MIPELKTVNPYLDGALAFMALVIMLGGLASMPSVFGWPDGFLFAFTVVGFMVVMPQILMLISSIRSRRVK